MVVNPAPAYERTYVASVLARPVLHDACRIDPLAISHDPYREALEAIMWLRLEDQRVSPTAVRVVLERNGWSDPGELIQHLRVTPVELDLEPVARRIKEFARARDFARNATLLAEAAARVDLDTCRELVGRMSLQHDAADSEQPVMTHAEMVAVASRAVLAAAGGEGALLSCGIGPIDQSFKISGGACLIVGAQTSVGKSSLATTMASNYAAAGISVGIISVEDPTEDYGAKSIGADTGINPSKMWMGRLSPEDVARILDSVQRASERKLPLHFSFVKSRELDDVLARIEFMARVRGVKAVVVDYLQCIKHRGGRNSDTRKDAIDNTLAELISLCGRLNIGLILLSQLSRPERGNPFKEPNLIDLKESGDIENRAQAVILLWRESDKPGMPVRAKMAKVKRVAIGVRFTLRRDPDSGMLVDAQSLRNEGDEDDAPATKPQRRPKQTAMNDEWGG